MAQIQTYPRKTTYDANDLILICDKTPDGNGVVTNDTKTTTISTIADNLNGVDGSGTAGKIPKWSDSKTLTDSIISESGGKIGIGTTAPLTILDVSANGTGAGAATGGQPVVRITQEKDSTSWQDEGMGRFEFFSSDGSSNSPYNLGYVGIQNDNIGQTAPSGALTFATTAYNASGGLDAATERMRITSTGNVGIGTTAPLEKLDIRGILRVSPDQISATQTGIILKDNGTGTNEGLNIDFQSASDTNTAFIGSISSDNLRIGTAGAERIRILGNGNVGIGTGSTAIGLLHVSAGTSGDARLILEADTDNNQENDTPQIWFKADGGITEGLVGLNDNFLDIMSNTPTVGGIRFLGGTANNTGTTDPYTGATVKMSITPTGEVGIGVEAPTEKLEVVGNIKTSGSLSLSKSSNSVKISTPTTITTSYELVMPAAVGTASQVLKLPSTIGTSPYQLAWGDASASGSSYQAGNGIDINTATTPDTLNTGLLSNGGLVFDTAKMKVDLAATAMEGELRAVDGGTGLSLSATASFSALMGDGSSTFQQSKDIDTALKLPEGATNRRPTPSEANAGMIRYNTQTANFEVSKQTTSSSGVYSWYIIGGLTEITP